MSEHDEELRKVLHRWESPAPRADLDRRVMETFRKSQPAGGRRWISIAAGILLLGALAMHLASRPPAPETTTITNAAGLQALPNGEITVEKGTQ
jgi:hypothetical protein